MKRTVVVLKKREDEQMNFYPHRINFEEVGMKVAERQEGSRFKVTFPEGWSLQQHKDTLVKDNFWEIIDASGRKRGYRLVDIMELIPRYQAGTGYLFADEENCQVVVSVMDNVSEEIIYSAKGELMRKDKALNDTTAYEAVKKYMDEHYPDWQNVTAYWD